MPASRNPQKPVILLLHGAFHRPIHYGRLIGALRNEGYTVEYPKLATSGRNDSEQPLEGQTHHDDVKVIHEAMEPHLEKGRNIIIVCHSFGGVSGTASVEGYSVAERENEDLPGGVVGVVYVAALALRSKHKGMSMLEISKEWDQEIYSLDWFDVEGNIATINDKGHAKFYDSYGRDIIEPDVVQMCTSNLVKGSMAALMEPVNYTAGDLPSSVCQSYVISAADQIIPRVEQHIMAAALPMKPIMMLSCGHSPFLTKRWMELVVKAVNENAKRCAGQV